MSKIITYKIENILNYEIVKNALIQTIKNSGQLFIEESIDWYEEIDKKTLTLFISFLLPLNEDYLNNFIRQLNEYNNYEIKLHAVDYNDYKYGRSRVSVSNKNGVNGKLIKQIVNKSGIKTKITESKTFVLIDTPNGHTAQLLYKDLTESKQFVGSIIKVCQCPLDFRFIYIIKIGHPIEEKVIRDELNQFGFSHLYLNYDKNIGFYHSIEFLNMNGRDCALNHLKNIKMFDEQQIVTKLSNEFNSNNQMKILADRKKSDDEITEIIANDNTLTTYANVIKNCALNIEISVDLKECKKVKQYIETKDLFGGNVTYDLKNKNLKKISVVNIEKDLSVEQVKKAFQPYEIVNSKNYENADGNNCKEIIVFLTEINDVINILKTKKPFGKFDKFFEQTPPHTPKHTPPHTPKHSRTPSPVGK